MSEHIKLVLELPGAELLAEENEEMQERLHAAKIARKGTTAAFKEFNQSLKQDPEALLHSLGHAAALGLDELPLTIKKVLDTTNDGRRIGFSPEANEFMWGKIFEDPRHKELRHRYADQEREWRIIANQRDLEMAKGDEADPDVLAYLNKETKDARAIADELSRQRAVISLGVMVAENLSRSGQSTNFSDYVSSFETPESLAA